VKVHPYARHLHLQQMTSLHRCHRRRSYQQFRFKALHGHVARAFNPFTSGTPDPLALPVRRPLFLSPARRLAQRISPAPLSAPRGNNIMYGWPVRGSRVIHRVKPSPLVVHLRIFIDRHYSIPFSPSSVHYYIIHLPAYMYRTVHLTKNHTNFLGQFLWFRNKKCLYSDFHHNCICWIYYIFSVNFAVKNKTKNLINYILYIFLNFNIDS